MNLYIHLVACNFWYLKNQLLYNFALALMEWEWEQEEQSSYLYDLVASDEPDAQTKVK